MDKNTFCEEMPLDAKSQYMRWVRSITPLSEQEKVELCERIEQGKQESRAVYPDLSVLTDAQYARERFVEGFQRLVAYMATSWQWRFYHLEWLDLVQEANVSLLHLLDHYDLCTLDNIGTFVAYCIKHGFWQALRDREPLIRLSSYALDRVQKVRQTVQMLSHDFARQPEVNDIAHAMQVPPSQVNELLHLDTCRKVTSLHALLIDEEEVGEDRWNVTPLYAENSPTLSEYAAAFIRQTCESVLTERQYEVIARYYGFDEHEPQSFQAIASAFAVTKHAIYQSYLRALPKVKQVLAAAYDEALLQASVNQVEWEGVA